MVDLAWHIMLFHQVSIILEVLPGYQKDEFCISLIHNAPDVLRYRKWLFVEARYQCTAIVLVVALST